MAIPEIIGSSPATNSRCIHGSNGSSSSRSSRSSSSSSSSSSSNIRVRERRRTSPSLPLRTTTSSSNSGAVAAATPLRYQSIPTSTTGTITTTLVKGVTAAMTATTTMTTTTSLDPTWNDTHTTPLTVPRTKPSLFVTLFGGGLIHEPRPPKSLSTPMMIGSTPTTLAMTPDDQLDDDQLDDDEMEGHHHHHHHPTSPDASIVSCNHKPDSYFETSSTEAVSSGKSSDTERCGPDSIRRPVLLPGSIVSSGGGGGGGVGRALFRPDDDNDGSDDDSERVSSSPRGQRNHPTTSHNHNHTNADGGTMIHRHTLPTTGHSHRMAWAWSSTTLHHPTAAAAAAAAAWNISPVPPSKYPLSEAVTPLSSKSRKQLRSRRSSVRSTARIASPPGTATAGAAAAVDQYHHHPLVPARDDGGCDDDVCDEEPEESSLHHRRRRKRFAVRTDSKPQLSWTAKLMQRLLTTKYIVWLLCLIGLTSVTMIVTTNHQLSQVDMERRRHDHIAVLFHRVVSRKHRSVSSHHPVVVVHHHPPPPPPPLNKLITSSLLLRGAAQAPKTIDAVVADTNRRTVNLNALAQWHETVSLPHSVRQPPPLTVPIRENRDHHHHHNYVEDQADVPPPIQHDAGRVSREQYSQEQHHHRRQHRQEQEKQQNQHNHEHNKHHQSHHGSEEARVYEKAMAGIIGMNVIPQVYPPPATRHVDTKASFETVDRFMYQPRGEAILVSPRIIRLDGALLVADVQPHRVLDQYPSDFTDNTQLYSVLDSGDERVATIEMRAPYEQGECIPMQKWQTTFNPSCNGIHELDISGMGDNRNEDDYKLFGMNGFWRNAWRYDSVGGHGILTERDTVVLKTLKINHRFEDAYFENNRIDAVVLERLTASPHVINVFGFCGHSIITEYADGKRLGELADKMKNVPLSRLQIARDIANGLADVHGIDGDGNATFVHLDINPANVVSIGGTLKLNDFNIGVLRRWNTTSNTPCGIPAQYPNPQWRSPEEARHERNLTEKVDVFSLGHIFFRLICGHEPWHKLEPGGMPSKDVLNEKVKQGILPTFPGDVIRSSDPEIVAIRKAMLRCYTYDPVDRPSARGIALYLDNALRKLEAQAAKQSA